MQTSIKKATQKQAQICATTLRPLLELKMPKTLALALSLFFTSPLYAWGFATGKVDVFNVNTYGNYSEPLLNGGFCFKLAGFQHYFKVPYSDSGEKRNNLLLVQSVVLAAHMAGKQLRVVYVDWGSDTTCRVEGSDQPAKFLENLQVLN